MAVGHRPKASHVEKLRQIIEGIVGQEADPETVNLAVAKVEWRRLYRTDLPESSFYNTRRRMKTEFDARQANPAPTGIGPVRPAGGSLILPVISAGPAPANGHAPDVTISISDTILGLKTVISAFGKEQTKKLIDVL